MVDPQSSNGPSGHTGTPGDDARVEHLLVTGLDHYFAGEFDSAINLWTRVLFLDRHHDRARAYIERARSAQAERQRQTEALVHQGLEAFDRGEVEQARALLSNALDRDASHDLALGVLGRIDRLDVGSARPAVPDRRGRREAARSGVVVHPRPSRSAHPARFWIINLATVGLLAAASWWTWSTNSWQRLWPSPAETNPTAAIPETSGPLPSPSAAEAYLRRGVGHFESGRFRDALVEFDRVPAGSPLRAEADQMRARIQRELLALALAETASGAGSPVPDPGPPRE